MDVLNYILFKNPVSSTLIQGTKGTLQYAGITPKNTSSAKSTMIREIVKPFEMLGGYRNYIRLVGLSGAAATVLGAVGSHRTYAPENAVELRRIFETANRFHFFGTLGLIAVPFTRMPHITGPLLITGTLLFCGPMYYRAFTNDSKNKVNRVVPFGGFMIIVAWLSMVI